MSHPLYIAYAKTGDQAPEQCPQAPDDEHNSPNTVPRLPTLAEAACGAASRFNAGRVGGRGRHCVSLEEEEGINYLILGWLLQGFLLEV